MSINELRKNKLIADAAYFEALAEELHPQPKPKPSKASLPGKVKKSSGIILSVVSVVAAIWGVIVPINGFIEEKKTMLRYQLNSQMIGLVEGLDSESDAVADRSILLLSYYERNSLPILFYKLEHISPFESDRLVINLIQTISHIYESNNDNKEATIEMIEERVADLLLKAKVNGNPPAHILLYGLYNIFLLIEHLQINTEDAQAFYDLLEQTESSLKQMDDPGQKYFESVYGKINDCKKNLIK